MTLVEAVADLCRHPLRRIVRQWHWKNALGSAIVRGALFFVVNVGGGHAGALRAVALECAVRIPLVGVLAAIAQHLTPVEPPWAARFIVMTILPGIALAVEFVMHLLAHTAALRASMLASAVWSIAAAAVSFSAMKRGVWIVGREALSLTDDVKRLISVGAGSAARGETQGPGILEPPAPG